MDKKVSAETFLFYITIYILRFFVVIYIKMKYRAALSERDAAQIPGKGRAL